MKIAVAGATGFIGEAFIERMLRESDCEIVALARRSLPVKHARCEYRCADLYSLKDAEKGLAGCDVGLYLIHSMSPSNRLTQGRFEDFDFILADNFARAAQKAGLRHIIYVGGIVPDDMPRHSRHLSSRLEVESVLAAYQTPLTTLRCSLIIGKRGSSFIILKKLVYRLRGMLLPTWVQTPCQPIFLDDLLTIVQKVMDDQRAFGKTYDCGGKEVITYRQLIERTARIAGKKRRLVDIPAIPLGLSKLWVRLISGASKSLVYPLIDSLNTPMKVSRTRQLDPDFEPDYTALDDALRLSLVSERTRRSPLRARTSQRVRELSEVKSVQRLPLPAGMNADQIARLYFRWLPRTLNWILKVEAEEQNAHFYLSPWHQPLLTLKLSTDRSFRSRQLFYITGGLLAKPNPKGRLEFRDHPSAPYVFAAIHDFRPALPWWIYRFTQAVAHNLVMWLFGRALRSLADKRMKSRPAEISHAEV